MSDTPVQDALLDYMHEKEPTAREEKYQHMLKLAHDKATKV